MSEKKIRFEDLVCPECKGNDFDIDQCFSFRKIYRKGKHIQTEFMQNTHTFQCQKKGCSGIKDGPLQKLGINESLEIIKIWKLKKVIR